MTKRRRVKPVAKQYSRALRSTMTDAEQRLWQVIRRRQLGGVKFRRQHPLGTYILDFVSIEAKLIIEVDGGQHGEQQDYDRKRTQWLQQQGYRVLRLWNNEVLQDIDAVKERVWISLKSED